MTSRRHNLCFDTLRGVAAIAVMVFHRRDWFNNPKWLEDVPLAVDFFFMLSGFVLASAYSESPSSGSSIKKFLIDRIIRLHPTLIFGAVLSLTVFLLDKAMRPSEFRGSEFLNFSLSLIPFPNFWTNSENVFPWNIALWSLFWEIVINLAFILGVRSLSTKKLIFLISFLSGHIIVTYNLTGVYSSGHQNDLLLFLLGFPRVFCAFFTGLILWRWQQNASLRRGALVEILCVAALVVSFTKFEISDAFLILWTYVRVFVVYPAIIVAAFHGEAVFPRVAIFLGSASYALYIFHDALLKILSGGSKILGLSPTETDIVHSITKFAIVICASTVFALWIESPFRRLLKIWVVKSIAGQDRRS